jgi:hypothetical protein
VTTSLPIKPLDPETSNFLTRIDSAAEFFRQVIIANQQALVSKASSLSR